MGIKFQNTSGIKDEKVTFANKRTQVRVEVMPGESAFLTLYYEGF